MTRLEKCELLKSKGYTYDPETGKIYGIYGKEITSKHINGYILITGAKEIGNLKAHHYGWYMTYGNVDFEMLDHINQIKTDNRIINLRISNHQKNAFNREVKGYFWDKQKNKWKSQIKVGDRSIHLGYFKTEEEAKNTYLEAKKIYHKV